MYITVKNSYFFHRTSIITQVVVDLLQKLLLLLSVILYQLSVLACKPYSYIDTHGGLTIVGAQCPGGDAVGPYGMMNPGSIHHSCLPWLLHELCQSPEGRKKNTNEMY